MYGLGKECETNRYISKANIYRELHFNNTQKKNFSNKVDKIYWQYSIKSSNTGVIIYSDEEKEYAEIEIIRITLKKECNRKEIAETIMKAIPYAILVVVEFKNSSCFVVEKQRTNKNDIKKNIVYDVIATSNLDNNNNWIKKINFNNFSKQNFYLMYKDLYDLIIYKIASDLGINSFNSNEDAKSRIDRIKAYEEEIFLLRSKLKKELQFNRKIEYSNEIKNLEAKIDEVRKSLNE